MLDQKDLIKKVKNYNKFLNPETLSKAYNFALKAQRGSKLCSPNATFALNPLSYSKLRDITFR